MDEYALYKAGQVRELDRRIIEGGSVGAYELMCRAGQAAFDLMRERWSWAWRVAVFCGRGNNGGDGYVLARLAREAGLQVRLFDVAGRRPAPDSAAARAREDFEAAGGRVEALSGDALAGMDLAVDALLGTGLDRPVSAAYAEAIAMLNESGLPVLALDLPSGLVADSGRVLGCAVRASTTVSFIGLKLGLFTADGRDQAGEVVFERLGVPEAVYADFPPAAWRLAADRLCRLLPPRAHNVHKGDFGHVLVVGGAPGMAGAARLAGEAALRCGAGRVTLATHPEHAAAIATARPELMCHAVDGGQALRDLLSRADVVAAGPGLGQGKWGRALWETLLAAETPLVLDADGLNLLAAAPRQRGDWVLTPHPGEAARLLGCASGEIQADRPAAAQALAGRFGAVVVLKGAGSLVAAPGGELAVCDRGGPGLATAGSGDVLTGVIAALRAQGLAAFEAAAAGVLIHALAGERAAGRQPRGLLAGDLMSHLRQVVNP